MTAVIIEDIPEVRAVMQKLIAEICPEIEIVGEGDSVVSGARILKTVKPNLVFLDIELPDGNGFDLLDIIGDPVQVIFTTASDTYAVQAFRYAAIDYLLKPIDPDQLRAAVDRALASGPLEEQQLSILSQALQERTMDRIALHTSDRIHIIDISSITRCEADGNYTRFFIQEKKPILVAKTLKEFDKLLVGAGFLRVHQSHLVHLAHVGEYVKTDGVYLVMKDGVKVPVSFRKRHDVLQRLDQMRPA